MRLILILSLLALGAPAAAQDSGVERRVDRIERELRAVQRRVFPNGAVATVEPEITPDTGTAQRPGLPATGAITDLTARVDALEAQLARLTGQSEENANRLRQLEQAFARLRSETEARLAAPPPPVPGPAPAEQGGGSAEAEPEQPTAAAVTDASALSAEEAYNVGFRHWDAGRYTQAQQALEAAVKAHPSSRWTSWANNLLGRAYLDDNKPATAAKVLLGNYQSNPQGERAADSLFFLGHALVRLDRLPDACKVYDELQTVYGDGLRDFIKQRLPAARSEAKCR